MSSSTRQPTNTQTASLVVRKQGAIRRFMAIALVAMGLVAGIATYITLADMSPSEESLDHMSWLFGIDMLILLGISALIAHHVWRLFKQRRAGIAGSNLHVSMARVFAMMAFVPTFLVTIFSLLFFHYGLQTWFSDQVKTAITESQSVAESYLNEHQQVMRADVLAMANDLERQSTLLTTSPEDFVRFVNTQTYFRNLSEALVFRRDGTVLAQSALTFSLTLKALPDTALDRANYGETVIFTDGSGDRVRALVKLSSIPDAYLFVGRLVDPNVISRIASTKEAATKYRQLEVFTGDLKRTLTGIFAVVALLMILAALWFGLHMAERLITPIESLIEVSERVRSGDMSARVAENGSLEEFNYLAKSFNRMTGQIEAQQHALLTINRQLDDRRRTTEAILRGVSSGVLSLDINGHVVHANHAALAILGYTFDELAELSIDDIFPEYTLSGSEPVMELQITDHRGRKRSIILKSTGETEGEVATILTFDDITTLKTAQRTAAWADVARRIAHEIKNPLTPIQLSAERLNRKFSGMIDEKDRTIFSDLIQTIIRHVGDIGQMVNEFSQFARMPAPSFQKGSFEPLVREVAILHREAFPDISFNVEIDSKLKQSMFDPSQVRQVMVNIVKNAVDALHEHKTPNATVNIWLGKADEYDAMIIVSDNGPGFPENVPLEQLTEPYTTHKAKGTGLGLAIVKKIMQDHRGQLVLGETPLHTSAKNLDLGGGAVITLLFGRSDNSESA